MKLTGHSIILKDLGVNFFNYDCERKDGRRRTIIRDSFAGKIFNFSDLLEHPSVETANENISC